MRLIDLPSKVGHNEKMTSTVNPEFSASGASSGIRELGLFAEGGMALLSLGETAEGEPVVIKRMRPGLDSDPTFRALFESEGRVAACLCHPHIAQLVERGEDVCGPFLVFERVEGTDLGLVLDAHLAEQRSFELVEVFAIFVPLLKALHAAHTALDDEKNALCIVHRDVSPGNVLLGEQGCVKLIDFGVADSVLKSHHTQVGELKGKFAYMAPEQTRGEALDPSADVFAAGIMLYECLTGRRLFDAETDADVVAAVRSQEVVPPMVLNADLDEALNALCLKMLERDASKRYASALEVAEALQEIAFDLGLESGWSRAIGALARAYPRPETSISLVSKRRHTQRVLGQTSDEVRPMRPRKRRLLAPVVLTAFVLMLIALYSVKSVRKLEQGKSFAVQLPDNAKSDVKEKARWSLHSSGLQKKSKKDPKEKLVLTRKKAIQKGEKTRDLKTQIRKGAKVRKTGVLQEISKITVRKARRKGAFSAKTTMAAPVGIGRLFLASEPWATIRIDGKRLKKNTPLIGWPLAAGEHVVELENPVYHLRKKFLVHMQEGKNTRQFIELAKQP